MEADIKNLPSLIEVMTTPDPVEQTLISSGLCLGDQLPFQQERPYNPYDFIGKNIDISTIQLLDQGGEVVYPFGVYNASQLTQLMFSTSDNEAKRRVDLINQSLFNAPVRSGEHPAPSAAYSGVFLGIRFDNEFVAHVFLGVPEHTIVNGQICIREIKEFIIPVDELGVEYIYLSDPDPDQTYPLRQAIGIEDPDGQLIEFLITRDLNPHSNEMELEQGR